MHPRVLLLVIFAGLAIAQINFNTNIPKRNREIPKTIKGQEQEILLLSEVLKAKQDLLTGQALEHQNLKKSLEEEIDALETELQKLNSQLTSLKAEAEGYTNKLNELSAKEEELNTMLASFDIPLTVDEVLKDQYNLVKNQLKNVREYEVYSLEILRVFFQSILDDFYSLLVIIKESPMIQSLSSCSVFQFVRSTFLFVSDQISYFYRHYLKSFLNPLLVPLAEFCHLISLKVSNVLDQVVSNVIMDVIIFLNGTWYVVTENRFTQIMPNCGTLLLWFCGQ